MKALAALLIATACIVLATEGARAYLDARATTNAQAAHAARAVAQDARLTDACAKGQTGVVLYYKGKHCAQGSN